MTTINLPRAFFYLARDIDGKPVGEVEITIAEQAIGERLAKRALSGRSGKAKYMHGLITARVVSRPNRED